MKIRDRIRELRRVPASELRPNPKNWRTHPEAQANALKGLLAEVGIADAVLVRELEDGSLMLLDGHLRAETLGDELVPCLVLDVDEAEGDKVLATLDPLAAMAEADKVKLDAILREIDTGSAEVQEMLAALADDAGLYQDEAKEIVEDEIPEPPADPITKPGDLWTLGNHRLLCGDSTKAEDVERLMAAELADLTFTDPPYGISLGVETPEQAKAHNLRTDGKRIENDNLKGERLAEFLASALAIVDRYLRPGGAFYVCSPIGVEVRKFIEAIEAAKWHYQTGLVWNKNSLCLSRFDYQPKHEIIHYGWKGGAAHKWRSDRTQTSVIDHAKPSKSEDHPTTKPVQLVAYFISNVSDGSDSVLDPFLGSGTTLIAAEQLGRKCYGMEISPQYCDVIVKRWETLTGKKAVLEKPAGKKKAK